LTLIVPNLRGKDGLPLPPTKRAKYFCVPKNRAGLFFDTEHVWTFHTWQHLADFESYELQVRLQANSFDLGG
jgi:hypothetical protein